MKKITRKHIVFLSISVIFIFSCTGVPTKKGNHKGNNYIKWIYPLSGVSIVSAGFSDVTGNGIPDIVITAGDRDEFITYIVDSRDGRMLSEIKRVVEKGIPQYEPIMYEVPYITMLYQDIYLPLVDLNNDGIDELFTLDDFYKNVNQNEYKFTLDTFSLSAISSGNSLLWSYKMESLSDKFQPLFFPFPFLLISSGDTDGDGGNDLVLPFGGISYEAVCVLNGNNGVLRWCNETQFLTYPEIGGVFDLNRDGAEDIIAFNRKSELSYCEIDAFDGKDGNVIWTKEINCDEINLSSGDIDNDSIPEVIVSCRNPPGLRILNSADGVLKYSFDFNRPGINEKILNDSVRVDVIPALGDVDGNGLNEIVLQKEEEAIADTNGDSIWGNCIDINGDGRYLEEGECDTLYLDNYLFAFSVQNGILWKYKNNPGEKLTYLIADVNDDGRNEVVVNYVTEEISDFELQVINGEDGSPEFWYGEFKDYEGYSEITNLRLWGIGDVDGDGMLELLTSGKGHRSENGWNTIVVLLRTDTRSPSDASLLPWPLPRHDKYQKNKL